MPTLEARIETERASRYLVQFCRHAAAIGGSGHTSRVHLHAAMTHREAEVAGAAIGVGRVSAPCAPATECS